MEITIGIQNVSREVSIDVELSGDEVSARVANAVQTDGILEFSDSEGKTVLVPAKAIGWVQLSAPKTRRVGFGLG